jgi:hypothetical protein
MAMSKVPAEVRACLAKIGAKGGRHASDAVAAAGYEVLGQDPSVLCPARGVARRDAVVGPQLDQPARLRGRRAVAIFDRRVPAPPASAAVRAGRLTNPSQPPRRPDDGAELTGQVLGVLEEGRQARWAGVTSEECTAQAKKAAAARWAKAKKKP